MDPLPLSKVSALAGGELIQGDPAKLVSRVSTDSRTLNARDLFVALRGENFDGHRFVEQAGERGATGAMVDASWKGAMPVTFGLIRVPDTLIGYQTLASNYRK